MNETIGFLLNDTARLYRRAFNARTKASGITALQWRLITYLKRHEGIRQGPLADLIEVEPITLSRLVDRLAEAGLVERRADPGDRRVWLLHLTEHAAPLLERLRDRALNVIAEYTAIFSDVERDQLVSHLRRLREKLLEPCSNTAEIVTNG